MLRGVSCFPVQVRRGEFVQMRALIVAACLTGLGGIATSIGATIYVAPGGSDANNGSDWELAKATIAGGVAAAGAGGTVIVSNGVYYPTTAISLAAAGMTVQGYSGNAADVIVDGSNTVRCFGISAADCTVRDLTMTHGKDMGDNHGGGLAVFAGGAGATARNCRFVANTNGNVGAGRFDVLGTLDSCVVISNKGNLSAGFYCNSSAIFTNCAFSWNVGGGSSIYGAQGRQTVHGCTFSSNSATSSGGAIYSATTATVVDCTFVANSSVAGGAVFGTMGAHVTGCTFRNNSASTSGGGAIRLNGGPSTITRSGFTNNSVGSSHGGAIYLNAGNYTVAIDECSFSGNASATASSGGAVYSGASVALTKCRIVGNEAGSGGGAFFTGGHFSSMVDCTIISNRAGPPPSTTGNGAGIFVGTSATVMVERVTLGYNVSSYRGGGAYVSGGRLLLRSCLLAGNANTSITSYGGAGYIASGSMFIESSTIARNTNSTAGGTGGFYTAGGATALTNSIVYFNAPLDYAGAGPRTWAYSCAPRIAGAGTITDDPLFVNLGNGCGTNLVNANFNLTALSPCKNQGINLAWMASALDLDNKPRLSDKVDMGAYEFYLLPGTVFLML